MDSKLAGLLLLALLFVAGHGAHGDKKQKETDDRLDFVRIMIQQSWVAYKTLAWGQDTIHSLTPAEHSDDPKSGETIISSLSTLYLANLTDEFAEAKAWLRDELNIPQAILIDSIKANTLYEFIGPLLSTYALTGDRLFLERAIEFAQYDSNVDFELASVDREDQLRSLLVEYQFLSDVTGNASYAEKARQLQSQLWATEESRPENYYLNGYPYDIEVRRAIQANGTYQPTAPLTKYRQIIDSAFDSGLFTRDTELPEIVVPHNLPFFDWTLYRHCDLGANLYLGAHLWQRLASHSRLNATERARVDRDIELALGITEMCYFVTSRTVTSLPPYKFTVSNVTHQPESTYTRYELAPELAESYFVLWRLTRDEKWRDRAWELTQAIFEYARFKQGSYGSVVSVNVRPTVLEDYQPIKALGATFKFLYLIFDDADEGALSTDQWVFNQAGQPFPICGQLPVYPESVCKSNQVRVPQD